MENKKTKLTISGFAKKSIKNFETAKSKDKKSVVINRQSKNNPTKDNTSRFGFSKTKNPTTFRKGTSLKPNFNQKFPSTNNDFEKRKLAEQRATKRLKVGNEGKERKGRRSQERRIANCENRQHP